MLTFLIILLILIGIFFSICYYCYWYAFKSDPKRLSAEYDVPSSSYKTNVIQNIVHLMNTPYEDVEIHSERDGVKLYGRYYHFKDGAPVALMMHGYRSNAFRDGNGGFQIALKYGLNVLMPDQRAHGKSEGKCIAFGVKERFDCAQWVEYLKNRFGTDVKVVLIGLSMGAATVMMASDIVPEENVKGIIADCGFSSPKAILTEVASQMKLPENPAYFFLKTGARIFGGFNPDEHTALKALKNTNIPVLFIHGEADNFVPCNMSRDCHENCVSQKQIFTVAKASHGMSYYLDTEGYTGAVIKFLDNVLKS